jgi:hypothetical protein
MLSRNYFFLQEMIMFKKILIGMLAIVILGSIATSGYEFGKYLAKQEAATTANTPVKANT